MLVFPRVLLLTGEWPVVRNPAPVQPSVSKQHAATLHAAGVPVEIFAFQGGPNPYCYLAAWTRLRPRLHRGRYDVAHCDAPRTIWIALPKRVPLVVNVSAATARSPLIRKADAVIVTSDADRPRIRTRAPVHVIPSRLDDAELVARLLAVYRSVFWS
ncbi:MAG TPA: glycosyltransferase [Gemmatimonadales bacterium]|jgi:acetyl esterase/lipase